MLYIFYYFIGVLWIAFWIYWLASAFGAKRTIRSGGWWYGALVRLIFLVAIVLLMQSISFQNFFAGQGSAAANPLLVIAGTLVVLAALGFAVWARVYLGKNWGMPMSVRENPELVTNGPYRFVRHPIYTGVLFALIGTGLAIGNIWFFAFVIFGVYFIYSATQEEKLMARLFPGQYLEYKKRTKMLIPFIL